MYSWILQGEKEITLIEKLQLQLDCVFLIKTLQHSIVTSRQCFLKHNIAVTEKYYRSKFSLPYRATFRAPPRE